MHLYMISSGTASGECNSAMETDFEKGFCTSTCEYITALVQKPFPKINPIAKLYIFLQNLVTLENACTEKSFANLQLNQSKNYFDLKLRSNLGNCF